MVPPTSNSTVRIDEGKSNTASALPVPLLDIARENKLIHDEAIAAITKVLESGRFILGPECERLENEIAQMCGVRYGIGCASGSDALLLALMALEIGPGDEVIVPSFTFFATASAVWRLGAKPVFVDIDPVNFNICPERVAEAIGPNTKAIIPVHLFGQPANMETLKQIVDGKEIFLIEDAAQAIGSHRHGKPAGSLGDIACFSFYPTKNLGACGDAGIMTTDNEQLADRLRMLRTHGMRPRYYHQLVGINSRLDSVQASFLLTKLAHLSEWSGLRQRNATRYQQMFRAAEACQGIKLPEVDSAVDHVWNQFTIRVPNNQRDHLRNHLSQANIGSEIYYPVPVHLQECFKDLGYQSGDLPVTEQAARDVLSLPIFPLLTEDEQQTVVNSIDGFFAADATPIRVASTQRA